MDNVLFIVPPVIPYRDFIKPDYNVGTIKRGNSYFQRVITDMPIGILSISSYIKKYARVNTKLVDFNIVLNKTAHFNHKSFIEFFNEYLLGLEYNPNIIGISSLFVSSYQSLLDIAVCCRKVFSEAIILGGGGVPTNLYRDIFKCCDDFDALCFGEGEKPFLELLKSNNKLQHLEENNTWITRDKINSNDKYRYNYIENLDEIPFYDYDILNTNEYALDPVFRTYAGGSKTERCFHVMTSRGCPYRCCFCASHSVHGRKMRYYSMERIKKDFSRLAKKYKAKTIIFQDDHLMGDVQRTLEILEFARGLKLKIIIQNGIAVYALKKNILKKFKELGINNLNLPIESGSKRVLKEIMHKPLNLDIVKDVVNNCRSLNIYTDINILIGLPGETKEDIENARTFLKSIKVNWFRIVVATPLPGSEMFDICVKENLLKHSYLDCNFKKPIIETREFTPAWIQEKAYSLNLELNFVCNNDLMLGCYELALKGFENAIAVKNDHAFAYYFAGKCYQQLGKAAIAKKYTNKARNIINKNLFWYKYAKKFGIV